MAEIKDLGKCEYCIHRKICNLKHDRQEIVNRMNDKLNIGCINDTFEFTFYCKEFMEDLKAQRGVYDGF